MQNHNLAYNYYGITSSNTTAGVRTRVQYRQFLSANGCTRAFLFANKSIKKPHLSFFNKLTVCSGASRLNQEAGTV